MNLVQPTLNNIKRVFLFVLLLIVVSSFHAADAAENKFMMMNSNGTVATWNFCKPVYYSTNINDGDIKSVYVDMAFAKISQVTGKKFVKANKQGIKISFKEMSYFREEVIGTSQFAYVESKNKKTIIESEIDINFSVMPDDMLYATLLHEIAHSLNLDHSEDPTSLMYYKENGTRDFSATDIANLVEATTVSCKKSRKAV